MPNQSNVYLPLSTFVTVRAYVNAAFNQQITFLQQNGAQTQYAGSGEHDTPIGQFTIQTPATSPNSQGYKVTVTCASWQNGVWVPSVVSSGSCSVMYYQLALVVSEDYIDQDWNDAVAIFTWWMPPSMRIAPDAKA